MNSILRFPGGVVWIVLTASAAAAVAALPVVPAEPPRL